MYRWNEKRLEYEFRNRLQGIEDDPSPSLGGYLDLSDKGMVAQFTAAENIGQYDVCYLNGSGEMAKAEATAESLADTLIALAMGAVTAATSGTFLLRGFADVSGFTAGGHLYVSTTAGTLTTTAPLASGNIVRVCGYAITPTQIFIDPDKTWIEVA